MKRLLKTSITLLGKPSHKLFVTASPRYLSANMYLYVIDGIFQSYPIDIPCQFMRYFEFQFCILMFSRNIRICISSFKLLFVLRPVQTVPTQFNIFKNIGVQRLVISAR